MNEKSIFKSIFKSTLNVMVCFVFVIAAVISLFMCRSTYKDFQNEDKRVLTEYTDNMKKVIEETMKQSDYILNYNYLRNNILKEGMTTEEKYVLSYDIEQYFKSIESDKSSYKIYFTNPEMFEGFYLYNISRLENNEKIRNKLKKTDPLWSEKIGKDRSGNEILSFYRKISGDNILECNIIIPKAENISVMKTESVSEHEVSNSINEDYAAVIQCESHLKTYAEIVIAVYAVILIFFAFMVFVMYMQNKKISNSLTRFIEKLEKVDVENIDENTEIDIEMNESETENKEIAVMKRIISELLNKVRQTVKQRYEIEYQRRETEYRLLQSQIDPHTLYNSLSAIKYIAFLKNDVTTMELVENMVLYYRAVLNRGKSVFTIGDEIQMLKYYVKINEFSHDRSYNFIEDVAEDVKDIEVMHLMIQPFAENAIIHGLIGREKKSEFKISCRKENEYVVFRIYDNGYGIPKERLEKLRDLENYDESYGIKNVYQRMKFVYGEDSDIIINSEENEGTEVVIKFRPKGAKPNV